MKPSAFLKYMQEIACLHSQLYGYGINDIEKNNIVWIIFCWNLNINYKPHWNEKIKIKTWLGKMDKLYCYRDFEVQNESGEVIAKAESQWIMFNIAQRKIEILNDSYQNKFPKVKREGYDNIIKKVRFDISKVDKGKCKKINYTVLKRDIDTNYHMNNTNYLDIASEKIADEIYSNLEKIEIHYKTECKYGDKIKFIYENKEDKILVYVVSQDESKVHTVIIFYMK